MKLTKPAVVAGTLFVVLVLVFQNCSQVQFDSVDPLEMGSTENGRILEFKAETKMVPQDIKVILVVDDSYTMATSQKYLSEKVRNLTEALQGRNVELLVTTTSDNVGVSASRYYVPYDTSAKLDSVANLPALKEIPQAQIPSSSGSKYVYERDTVPGSKAVFKITKDMSQSQFSDVTTAITQTIKNIGVNGNSNERGICPVLRHLVDTRANAFLKDGDRVGVIIISDEDDQTNASNCITGSKEIAYIELRVYYTLNFRVAHVKYTRDSDRDGVSNGVSQQGVLLPVDKSGWADGATCSEADQSKFRGEYPTMYECKYQRYGYPVIFKASEFSGASANSLCNSSFLAEGNRYEGLRAYYKARINSSYAAYADQTDCTFDGADSNGTEIIDRQYKYIGSVQKNAVQNLKTLADARFKNNFFISAIFHRKNESCALSEGHRYGNVYESLLQQFGSSHAYLHSICENNYSEPLAQLSGYVKQVQPVLKIESEPGEKVTRVSLRNGSSEFVLNPQEYSFNAGTLVIHSDKLNENSIVRVFLSRP